MKEQATDISKVLQGMTEEIRLLRGTVNQQYAEIIKWNRNINALDLEIRKKDTELINLRERLAKYENPDKNSNEPASFVVVYTSFVGSTSEVKHSKPDC